MRSPVSIPMALLYYLVRTSTPFFHRLDSRFYSLSIWFLALPWFGMVQSHPSVLAESIGYSSHAQFRSDDPTNPTELPNKVAAQEDGKFASTKVA